MSAFEELDIEDRQRLALTAACQASAALAELVRFSREGADSVSGRTFGDDVIELLLDAAKLAIEASASEQHDGIYRALCAELEGWA